MNRQRRIARLVAAIALAGLWLLPSLAFAQGQVLITDETGELDEGALRSAARPLTDDGVLVGAYLLQQADAGQCRARMLADGLIRSDGAARTEMVSVCVGLQNRFSAIFFGDGLNAALAVNENYETLRATVLNPGLSEGDFSAAFAETFRAVNAAIDNPPDPDGGVNVDTTPIVVGGAVAATATLGGVIFVRRRRALAALNAAREGQRQAREQVGVQIAESGQLLRNIQEQSQFDAVTYSAADLADLQRRQAAANEQFVSVQTRFDDVGEAFERHEQPKVPEYEASTAQYNQLLPAATAVKEAFTAIMARRSELDQLARQAPEDLNRLKKS